MLATQAFTSPVAQATLLVAVDIDWHIGDVIAKLRKRRRMNQTVLGLRVGVNKATIVRAEAGDPKVSRDTYIKIARVLGTDLAALEVEAARLDVNETGDGNRGGVSGADTPPAGPLRSVPKSGGRALATSLRQPDQADPVSGASRDEARRAATDLLRLANELEPADAVARSPRSARVVGQHAATPPAAKPGRRPPGRKRRR